MSKIGIKIANQTRKGAPRNGCFEDVKPASKNSRNYADNPAKAMDSGAGTETKVK